MYCRENSKDESTITSVELFEPSLNSRLSCKYVLNILCNFKLYIQLLTRLFSSLPLVQLVW